MGSLPLEFWVAGDPKTAGSKVTGVAHRKVKAPDGSTRYEPVRDEVTGKLKTFTKDSSAKGGENWRADVRAAAERELGDGWALLDEPLVLTIVFHRLRPKGHFRADGVTLTGKAPAYPTPKPDATKMLRAVEDALTGLVWVDDSRVVSLKVDKIYGPAPGALVRIERKMPVDVVADGVQAVTPLFPVDEIDEPDDDPFAVAEGALVG